MTPLATMTPRLAAALAAPALVLTALVVGDWDLLQDGDIHVVRAATVPSGPGRQAVKAVTQLGAPLLLELVTLVAAVLLLRRGLSRVAGQALVAVFGAALLSSVLKSLVDRSRPCAGLVSCPTNASYPSGHATASAAFYVTAVLLLRPWLGDRVRWLLAVPVVVGVTRVLLGVHYPSDVVGGLLVGGCWAVICAWALAGRAARDDQREAAG